MKPVGVHAQHLLLPAIGGAQARRRLTLRSKTQDGDPVGILADECSLAGLAIVDLIEVVPRFVAVVDADVDDAGLALGRGDELHLYALQAGQVARRTGSAPAAGRGGGIDGIEVEILVAVVVLDVGDELGVSRPEEVGTWAAWSRW